ncbi:MAG: hypothetical protein LBB48_09830 [Treponema sp.]|nr:hypothetical protein [Treponema sp.]
MKKLSCAIPALRSMFQIAFFRNKRRKLGIGIASDAPSPSEESPVNFLAA